MRISRPRVLVALASLASLASVLALAAACSDQENPSLPASAEDTTPDGGGGTTTTPDGGGTSPTDGATDGGGGCVLTSQAPASDGGGNCGAMALGTAAAFGPVDASDNDYDGGAIPPGIYEAFAAERLSANPGSWNETLVLGPGNRFTRVRQLDIGSGPGAVTERSGTYATSGNQITFTYDCAYSNGTAVDAGSDTIPYEVVGACNDAVYRHGVTGVRITFKRR